MLKYIIAFCLISFCSINSSESDSYAYSVFLQRFAMTNLFYERMRRPEVRIDSDEYIKYTEDHRTLFETHRWVIRGLLAYNSNNEVLSQSVDPLVEEMTLDSSLLDQNFKPELKTKWPVLTLRGSDDGNWAANYFKFGCFITENVMHYFEEAVTLFNNLNAGTILRNAHIYPGDECLLNRTVLAFTNALEKRVIIRCLLSEDAQRQYLFEVMICLKESDQLQDCPVELSENDVFPCDSDQAIYYPLFPADYM